MIVVAGESLVDLIPTGAGALAPLPGGGPYNVARALARLEVPVAFVGAVADDRFGRMLRDGLAADGVDLRGLVPTAQPTTLAVAELDDEGSAGYRFYTDGTAAPALTVEDALAATNAFGDRPVAALHVGSLGLALQPIAQAVEALIAAAAPQTIVMVDPNWRPGAVRAEQAWRERLRRALRRADIVKLSVEDLAHLDPDARVSDAAHRLLAAGARCVLVTDGPSPVRAFCPDAELALVPPPVQVADTVGAGDAFGAGFLAWCIRHGVTCDDLGDPATVRAGAEFAALIAARTCARAGADPPRLSELEGAARLAAA